eukprot:TRINITY_DN5814_c0_g1_i2.p3 TRINITY_DN5814_c0_g1~~TRINITY_DN5814_c0_g1_i2.p3  ORF type:complete len:122 (+),score=27.92 TRINITY_DN5814_c0_g1_i2:488-853(+)
MVGRVAGRLWIGHRGAANGALAGGEQVMLVGGKADLAEQMPNSRQVDQGEAAAFANEHDLLFMETSSVTAHNVSICFDVLLQAIYERSPGTPKGASSNASLQLDDRMDWGRTCAVFGNDIC